MAHEIKLNAFTRHDRKVNVNTEVENVEVRWMFTPDAAGRHKATLEVQPGQFREVAGRYTFTVIVRSEKFPRSKLVGEVKWSDENRNVTSQAIGVLAGAMSEHLNERFGDNLEPSDVAKAAQGAFFEMLNEQRAALLQSTT